MQYFNGRWVARYTDGFGPRIEHAFETVVNGIDPNILKTIRESSVPEEHRALIRKSLDDGEAFFSQFGFVASRATMQVIRRTLDGPSCTTGRLHELSAELRGRLMDELDGTFLMAVDANKTHYLTSKQLFGPQVEERFPSTVSDIVEAGRCLAFGRETATVFHLMRVMEVALRALSKALGIPYAPSWESHIRQITKELEKPYADKTPEWKKDEPFYREALGDLIGVKLAWRNPTMHVKQAHGSEEAAETFAAVRRFMQQIATKLGED